MNIDNIILPELGEGKIYRNFHLFFLGYYGSISSKSLCRTRWCFKLAEFTIIGDDIFIKIYDYIYQFTY